MTTMGCVRRGLLVFMVLSSGAAVASATTLTFDDLGLAEGNLPAQVPQYPGVTFVSVRLAVPGGALNTFNGNSTGHGAGGFDNANSGNTISRSGTSYMANLGLQFDAPVANLTLDVADVDANGEQVRLRVYDAVTGGNLLASVTVTGGNPGTGDGILTPVSFAGLADVRRLEVQRISDAPGATQPGYAIDNVSYDDALADSDGDGVPDATDDCPGYDDTSDADADGTPDGCDVCPLDVYNDSDGDGACDSSDACPLDPADDHDADGLCGDVDPCPNDPLDDLDGDGVCGDVDGCPSDPANDADGDGVCGNVDVCPFGDDSLDTDGDGAADDCDVCPLDPANDADGDLLCADLDPCPIDAHNDGDGDGSCADADVCEFDALDDADGDGLCGDVDACEFDAANDADGDGLCEIVDNCPTVANANQSDVDGDGIGDECEPDNDGDGVIDDTDNCPLDPNPDQLDTDGDLSGDACDADGDGDGVTDENDVCLATVAGAPVLANGCSVAQQCQCDNGWKNHGAYVSCVAHATNALRAAGVITQADQDAVMSAAGGSSCGMRR